MREKKWMGAFYLASQSGDWKVMIVACSLFHTAICCKEDGTSHICSGPGWDASVFYEHEKNVSPH